MALKEQYTTSLMIIDQPSPSADEDVHWLLFLSRDLFRGESGELLAAEVFHALDTGAPKIVTIYDPEVVRRHPKLHPDDQEVPCDVATVVVARDAGRVWRHYGGDTSQIARRSSIRHARNRVARWHLPECEHAALGEGAWGQVD
jgi:hypothetical protein